MRCQLKNPLPPAPFHLLSTPGSDFSRLHCPSPFQAFFPFVSFLRATPTPQLPCRSPFYIGWVSPTWRLLPVLSPLHTWVELLPIQLSLHYPSPLHARFEFPSTQLLLPCPSPLCAWVGFPPTQFLLPYPSPLCAQVELLPIRFSFTSLCYKYMSMKL